MKLLKTLFVLSFLLIAAKSQAQYTLTFHVPTTGYCPESQICITPNCGDCGSCCTGLQPQSCKHLNQQSPAGILSFPFSTCGFDPCMSWDIDIQGCNDANQNPVWAEYSLSYINGAWTIRPYGVHAGGPITLILNDDLTMTPGAGM